jgi:excisionase family DNA binding protein
METQAQTNGNLWMKADVAAHLQCSKRHIDNLLARKLLPYVKIGHLVRFRQADVDRALARMAVNPR